MLKLDIPTSGSVGNQTHSRGRSGQIVRQRSMPTNPNSSAQSAARSRLGSLSAAWRGLTDPQRAAWTAFGSSFTVTNALGSAITLTGHQCYVKVNTTNLLNGDAIVAVPPSLPSFVAVTVTGLTADSAVPEVILAGASPAAGTDHMVYASPQRSAGVSFENDFRYIGTFNTATSSEFSIGAAYAAKFGAIIADKKIFVQVVQSQDGMQDNGTIFSTIVA